MPSVAQSRLRRRDLAGGDGNIAGIEDEATLMRIETYSRYGSIGFVVHAETAEDRALLSLFTSDEYRAGKVLEMAGHTYSCDHSAVTSFNFGFVPRQLASHPQHEWKEPIL